MHRFISVSILLLGMLTAASCYAADAPQPTQMTEDDLGPAVEQPMRAAVPWRVFHRYKSVSVVIKVSNLCGNLHASKNCLNTGTPKRPFPGRKYMISLILCGSIMNGI